MQVVLVALVPRCHTTNYKDGNNVYNLTITVTEIIDSNHITDLQITYKILHKLSINKSTRKFTVIIISHIHFLLQVESIIAYILLYDLSAIYTFDF